MTESLQSYSERNDGLRPDISMADKAIANIIDPYEESLQNGSLAEFRGFDAGRKVDSACWELAKNPETYSQAVSLRSWHTIRLFERELATLDSGEWPYWFFLTGEDPWTRNVLRTTDAYLPKFIATHYSADPRPELTINNQDSSIESILLRIENRALVRREWRYANGEAYQVAYIVKAS